MGYGGLQQSEVAGESVTVSTQRLAEFDELMRSGGIDAVTAALKRRDAAVGLVAVPAEALFAL